MSGILQLFVFDPRLNFYFIGINAKMRFLAQTKGQRESERERKRKGKEEERMGEREKRKGKGNWK